MGKVKAVTNIHDIRRWRGLTLDELAEQVGYSDRSMMSRAERGLVDIPLSRLIKIANALNVSLNDIVGDRPWL